MDQSNNFSRFNRDSFDQVNNQWELECRAKNDLLEMNDWELEQSRGDKKMTQFQEDIEIQNDKIQQTKAQSIRKTISSGKRNSLGCLQSNQDILWVPNKIQSPKRISARGYKLEPIPRKSNVNCSIDQDVTEELEPVKKSDGFCTAAEKKKILKVRINYNKIPNMMKVEENKASGQEGSARRNNNSSAIKLGNISNIIDSQNESVFHSNKQINTIMNMEASNDSLRQCSFSKNPVIYYLKQKRNSLQSLKSIIEQFQDFHLVRSKDNPKSKGKASSNSNNSNNTESLLKSTHSLVPIQKNNQSKSSSEEIPYTLQKRFLDHEKEYNFISSSLKKNDLSLRRNDVPTLSPLKQDKGETKQIFKVMNPLKLANNIGDIKAQIKINLPSNQNKFKFSRGNYSLGQLPFNDNSTMDYSINKYPTQQKQYSQQQLQQQQQLEQQKEKQYQLLNSKAISQMLNTVTREKSLSKIRREKEQNFSIIGLDSVRKSINGTAGKDNGQLQQQIHSNLNNNKLPSQPILQHSISKQQLEVQANYFLKYNVVNQHNNNSNTKNIQQLYNLIQSKQKATIQ